MTGVGVIVNPWAGKDLRRLHAPVGHVSDRAKIGVVRRVAVAALEAGAGRVVAAGDAGRISRRALHGLAGTLVVEGPGTGSALDSRRGANQLVELGCAPIVVIGGDGTCRDVAIGAPGAALIGLSTGTNNVFPVALDGSSAGTAAGLVASGALDLGSVAPRAKVLRVLLEQPDGSRIEDLALVDVALTDDLGPGARAVVRPESIKAVVAAIATPTSTGLSAIAGRLHPLGRHDPGAVVVHLGGGGRVISVPIVPGSFHLVEVGSVERVGDGGSVRLAGPGVLAFDGERDRVLAAGAVATVTVRSDGPPVVDVDAALHAAAALELFDQTLPPAIKAHAPVPTGPVPGTPPGSRSLSRPLPRRPAGDPPEAAHGR